LEDGKEGIQMIAQAFPKLIRPDSCASCSAMLRASPQVMECRLNPPVVHPILGQNAQGAPQLIANVTLFPQVRADMFCKQFKRSVIADDRLTGVQVEGVA
jgi:hypothetical protein